jgi:Ni2+-binding GTPase involved in maturation of urease and hydrogenase
MIRFLNCLNLRIKLNCSSGKVAGGRWGEGEPVVKHAEINVVEKDKMVKNLEARIEQLQDELDQWNHVTIIDMGSAE